MIAIRWVSLASCLFVNLWAPSSVIAQTDPNQAEAVRMQLKELIATIPAPEYVGRNPESDLESLRNRALLKNHFNQVKSTFAREIQAGRQPYANLGYTLEHAEKTLSGFEKAAADFGAVPQIQADLEHAQKMAKQAGEYEAPAYFKPDADIPIRMALAGTRIRYLEVLAPDSEELRNIKDEMVRTTAVVREAQQTLIQRIIEQNEPPSDNYQGADKDELLKLIRTKWEQSGVGGKILGLGIPGAEWSREVSWIVENKSLYKKDVSRLQAFVLTLHDDQFAICHRINLTKDHLNGDRMEASFLNDPKSAPEPIHFVLRTKLKN